MEPSPKRPRLSIFQSDDSGRDLDIARYNNDMTLKNKWEAIFEKYSKDFSTIADEIDIMTGEIVVNRGHIEGMETETDPGRLDGTSLLRFISDAQETGEHYPGKDQVLQSIETMAETAAQNLSDSELQLDEHHSADASLIPYDSDSDSLFADGAESSADSLFMGDEQTIEDHDNTSPFDLPENDDILAKFGPHMGQEVLEIIEQRQQAHIEPAWRIPVAVEPRQLPKFPRNLSSVSSTRSNTPQELTKSIWLPPKPSARYESEDPLQEDFNPVVPPPEAYSSDGYLSNIDHVTTDEESENLLAEAKTGSCNFCHNKYGSKSSVMAHFDRVLKKYNKSGADGVHDHEAIRKVRSRATRRVRLQRLTVDDFKSMVEFHEGAGLSFDHIATSKVLRTRKTGPQLQHIYHQHRTVAHLRETPEPERRWPAEQDAVLLELAQKPLTTITTLRRNIKGRNELEIGNHLADIWLDRIKRARIGDRVPHGASLVQR